MRYDDFNNLFEPNINKIAFFGHYISKVRYIKILMILFGILKNMRKIQFITFFIISILPAINIYIYGHFNL
jgi:hypothetical protein